MANQLSGKRSAIWSRQIIERPAGGDIDVDQAAPISDLFVPISVPPEDLAGSHTAGSASIAVVGNAMDGAPGRAILQPHITHGRDRGRAHGMRLKFAARQY